MMALQCPSAENGTFQVNEIGATGLQSTIQSFPDDDDDPDMHSSQWVPEKLIYAICGNQWKRDV